MMNYQSVWDVNDVIHQLFSASIQCQHSSNTAEAWGLKQDLYQVKWLLEEYLKNCPNFPNESAWIKRQEENRIIKLLKE